MLKQNRFLLFIVLAVFVLSFASSGMAAHQNCQDLIAIGNRYLDQMQIAYQTENLPLFLSLYNDPVVAVDVTRDQNYFYTNAQLKDELGSMFRSFSGIQCTFANRQISAEGDMIMIRTWRSFTANEFPLIANCEMLMILRKSFTHRTPWNYDCTDQILLREEYIPKSEQNTALNKTVNEPAPQQPKTNQSHKLLW